MIYIGSRYETSQVIPTRVPNKDAITLSVLRPSPESVSTPTYTYWRDGDRWDLLSIRTYGTASRWWQILDANPDIDNPIQIRPGTKILLP